MVAVELMGWQLNCHPNDGKGRKMKLPVRRAFTLIEMIVVISVSAAMMTIAISVLLVLFRAERSGRAHVAQAESLERLADQFRRDVHASPHATLKGKTGHRWQFDSAGNRTVRYMTDADSLWREEEIPSKNARTEPYMLPKDSAATVEINRSANPPVVTLTIRPKDAALGTGQQFRIEAVLGRDLRFALPAKEAK
jgi:prepilin-type N-terminal cleavage/methylation domain-containing protein